MKIIRNIIVAFSLYSKIPMPVFEWQEDDTRYAIAFLPLVGLVIAGLELLMMYITSVFDIPVIVKSVIWILIPLLLTGGFHLDGFMDVQDALKSYQPREKKLEILKDPHIGAFSVISLVTYGLTYFAAIYLFIDKTCKQNSESLRVSFFPLAFSFVLARIMGAYLPVRLKHARDNGMLHEETKMTGKSSIVILAIESVLCISCLIYCTIIGTVIILITIAVYSVFYKRKCDKEFGGITGDTTGYYIVELELYILLANLLIALIGV